MLGEEKHVTIETSALQAFNALQPFSALEFLVCLGKIIRNTEMLYTPSALHQHTESEKHPSHSSSSSGPDPEPL